MTNCKAYLLKTHLFYFKSVAAGYMGKDAVWQAGMQCRR